MCDIILIVVSSFIQILSVDSMAIFTNIYNGNSERCIDLGWYVQMHYGVFVVKKL